MAKGKRQHKHCQIYLNNRRRIKNKTRKLEKKIRKLDEARKEDVINPNTNLPPKRKSIENIIKSCRIGKFKEGFDKEKFKFLPRKKKE